MNSLSLPTNFNICIVMRVCVCLFVHKNIWMSNIIWNIISQLLSFTAYKPIFFIFHISSTLNVNVVVFLRIVITLKGWPVYSTCGRSGFYFYLTLHIALSIYSLSAYEIKPFSEKCKYIYYCRFLLFTLRLSKSLIRLHFLKEKMNLATLEDYLRYVCSNIRYVCIKLHFANFLCKGKVELN